jgi:hypothetical protein
MHKNNDSQLSFIDLWMNLGLALMALFILAYIQINVKQKSKKVVQTNAEFIITISWDSQSDDDVDGYLEDPSGNVLYFRAREIGVMHLDRDDLGKKNDIARLSNGETIQIEDNREIITLRGVIPGEYTLNVHMYQKNDVEPTTVTVTVDKINPYSTVKTKDVTMIESGQEKTICRFTLNADGVVEDVNELAKPLIGSDQYYNEYDDEGGE